MIRSLGWAKRDPEVDQVQFLVLLPVRIEVQHIDSNEEVGES